MDEPDLPPAEAPPAGEPPAAPSAAAPPAAAAPAAAPLHERRRARTRPSRWDRPPEPHDWRWVVGHLGRALITIGLLMFAFVGYQLWGTGIQTSQAQDTLTEQFDQQLAAAATSTSAVATTVAPTTSAAATPSSDPSTSDPTVASTTPPTITSTTTAPTPATVPAPARPGIGAAVAKLQIPSIGLDWTVVEGVSTPALAKGPGHFPESRLPGQLGNAALAGHRTTHGAPFGDLDRLQDGDQIIVTTLAGRYVYLVTGRTIVSPDEYGKVIPTTDPTTATLVLATCHPKWTSSQRLIIFAVLDASGSSPLTAPSAAGAPSTGSIPGDDSASTSATPSTGPGSTAPAGTAGSATTVATGGTSAVGSTGSDTTIADAGPTGPADTSVVDAAAGPDTTEAAPSDASSQAFGGGWFDDPDAWPHVIAWGLLLIAIWVGAYRLAKRFRRLWLGILVGFAPFVVVLYFWFENVNRLLPPNL